MARRARAADREPSAPPEAASQAIAAAAKPVELRPLLPTELKLLEFCNADRSATACAGAMPEDYLDPAMWSLVDNLYPFDVVRMVAANGTWWAEYLISHVEGKTVSVKLLMAVELTKPTPAPHGGLPPGYSIRRGDPGDGQAWCVIRDADQFLMNPNMDHRSYDDCRTWLLSLAIFRVQGPTEYLP